MAMNFEKLTAAVDRISSEVTEVVDIIKNPRVDNNDQAVIDDITSRLEGAADALDAVADESSSEEIPADPMPGEETNEDATFINGSTGGTQLGTTDETQQA